MEITGSFALCISDKKLNFKDIEESFPIEPSKIIRKGQMIGKLKNIKAPYDIWIFEKSIGDSENIFNELSILLDQILPYCVFIRKAYDKYECVKINCYLRSEFGQMGFELSKDIITKLEKLGLGLDFHILSFGAVSD